MPEFECQDLAKYLGAMNFDSSAYGQQVASILSLDRRNGLLPLQQEQCSSEEARALLKTHTPSSLFRLSRAPEAAFSGLWLLFSCHEESHALSQDLSSPEGSYWHGILHRQEGDTFNANYWFRKVGDHPIFPALNESAKNLAVRAKASLPETVNWEPKAKWDPEAFAVFYESSRRQEQSEEADLAKQVQRLEWRMLFDYCARPVP